MKRLIRKKGFTLTETLIGIVVFLILAGTSSSVMLTAFNLYGRTALKNSAQNIGDTVYELLDNRLSYCNYLVVGNASENCKPEYMCIKIPKDGKSVIMGANTPSTAITDDSQFTNMKMVVDAEIVGSLQNAASMLKVTVTVYAEEDGRELYTRTGVIKLYNAVTGECEVTGADGGNEYSSKTNDLYFVFGEVG